MEQQIEKYGRYAVIEETLTDGSCVYDIRFDADSGQSVSIACTDEMGACELAQMLQTVVGVDVAVAAPDYATPLLLKALEDIVCHETIGNAARLDQARTAIQAAHRA